MDLNVIRFQFIIISRMEIFNSHWYFSIVYVIKMFTSIMWYVDQLLGKGRETSKLYNRHC
jgi:hypothetical protein